MNTAQYARELGVSPETLRQAHSRQGHYFGAVPAKAANGRLIWPVAALERLKGGAK